MDKITQIPIKKLFPITGAFLVFSGLFSFWYSNQVPFSEVSIQNKEALCYVQKPSSHTLSKIIAIASFGLGVTVLLRDWFDKEDAETFQGMDIEALNEGQEKEALEPEVEQYVEESLSVRDKYPWFYQLLDYPTILLFGVQGSGKSVFLKYLARIRQARGHKIVAFDPHAAKGDWDFVDELVGPGTNYKAIDAKLSEMINLVTSRYRKLMEEGNQNFRPITIFAEEMTQYANELQNASMFFKKSLSDFRKINLNVVYVSHGRNLSNIGGGHGSGELRNGLLELRLQAEPDGQTGEVKPTRVGLLKRPGEEPDKQKNWENVQIPDISEFEYLVQQYQNQNIVSNESSFQAQVYEQCRQARELGWNRSYIIENLLKCKGNNYKKGKEYLEKLEAEYGVLP